MKIATALCSLFYAIAAFAQTAVVSISNTNQANPGYYIVVGPGNLIATSFTTTTAATNLFAVTVVLDGGYAFTGGPESGVLGPLILQIYSDAGGSPGTSLAVLSGNSYPTNAGAYVYACTNGLTLASGMAYWVVASTPGSSGEAGYKWGMTPSTNTDSGSFWTEGLSEANPSGNGWSNIGDSLFFAVTIDVTPPAIAISQPVMLAYPTPSLPFVLQQSSSLNTNWVAVTNAILQATNGGQTIYIVPSSAQQMFYRLNYP